MFSTRIPEARSFINTAFICASVVFFPSLSFAQDTGSLKGVVTDVEDVPVFGAVVEIGTIPGRARTNERGEFHLTGVPAGTVEIKVRRLGFSPATKTAQVSANASVEPMHVILPALPVTVQPVVVEASRVEFSGRLAGYYERLQRRSSGTFISRDVIDRSNNKTLSQLLSATPGVSALRMRVGGGVRMRGRSCRPLIWLDGTPLPAGEVDLDAFPISTLHGIEVYLGSTNAPSGYTALRGQSSCGTILLWSRGRDTDQPKAARRRSIDLEELAASHTVFTTDQVDTPAQLVQRSLELSYPPEMFASGTAGSAVAEFVVDATGKIEAETFEIFSATHPAFAAAVTRALSNAQFTPARKNGVTVRQLVQQPFNFDRSAPRTSTAQD
jgi:TonB family protein